MNSKFRVYALIVSFVCSTMSWGKMFAGTSQRSGGGSSWSSNYGGGSSWGGGSGGGHK